MAFSDEGSGMATAHQKGWALVRSAADCRAQAGAPARSGEKTRHRAAGQRAHAAGGNRLGMCESEATGRNASLAAER